MAPQGPHVVCRLELSGIPGAFIYICVHDSRGFEGDEEERERNKGSFRNRFLSCPPPDCFHFLNAAEQRIHCGAFCNGNYTISFKLNGPYGSFPFSLVLMHKSCFYCVSTTNSSDRSLLLICLNNSLFYAKDFLNPCRA